VTGNTGTGGSTFNIGSYGSTGYLNGLVDEVVLRATAVDGPTIRAAYQAGRGIASVRSQTTYGGTTGTPVYHLDAHPTQSAVQAVANGDFAEGLSDWTRSSTATYDGTGIRLPTSATATQVAQLVPGQRVHFQVAGRTDGTTGSTARLRLSYWQVSTASWVDLVDDSIANTTTWTTRAFQYTIPSADTTGLLRVSLSDGSGIGEARFDDVLLVTAWQAFGYRSRVDVAVSGTTPRYLQDGLLEKVTSFDHASSIMTQQRVFTATTSHPAIFATSTIENHVDGAPGPGADVDVTTTVSYDSWGRALVVTDPDGVVATTVYATNLTDVAETWDGLGQKTKMTYDPVGNLETTTSPLGRVASATFDARNQVLTTTGPDGVVSRTDYDTYGRATATWANYADGNPATGDGTDDLLTIFAYDEYGRVKQTDAECGSVGTCATNGLDARTATSYDLLRNAVTRTVYAGTDATLPRVTTNHFETYATGGTTYSRTSASGVQLAIAPSASTVPFCPGSSTTRCNTAATWKLNGSWVSAIEPNGRSFATTDGNGIVTLTDLDLAGRTVRTIANYDVAGGSTSDTNVVTRTEYNLVGDPIVSWDAAGRRDVRTYDVLGRLLSVSHRTTTGSEYLLESTVYRPSGRVERTSDGASWTRTLYDGAGRATQTIANYDTSAKAGMVIDAIESGESAETGTAGLWKSTTTGAFVQAAPAALSTDGDTAGNAYHTVAPVSGRGRLHVTTSAGSASSGTWFDLSGPTYQSGHVYKASFDLVTDAATALTAYLGQDQGGGSFGTLAIGSSPTVWTRYTVSWTAGSNLTTPIHFAITKTAAGTAHLYLDNLVVWDSTAGWTDKGIVSSVSAYDADGEVIASVLPPGDPATERPLVTSVAFDPAGRTVASVTNGASGAYAATVLGTASLAAYVPLDERVGTSTADKKSGATALAVPATLTLGVAGGIDEARTGIRLTGANGYPSRTSNATSNTTNVSMEAWVRSDITPSGTVVVAANGTAASGWGLGIGATGVAAGFTISGSTLTTMANSVTVTDGAWHHLVLTRGASTWAMTIDGSAVTLSNNTTSPGTPGAYFTIGALSDGTRPFVGEVDEVSVYTADISGSTAAAHWAAGRRPSTDTVTALTTRNAYDRLGRLVDAWAPDLVRTRAAYDRLGNQVETIANYRDGSTSGGIAADDVKSTFAYDVLGELIGYCPAEEVMAGGCTPSDVNEAQAWRYVFDDLGRQIKTIPPVNTTAVVLTTEEVVYEPGGRIAMTCRYPAGTSCGSVNSRHVDFTYDNLGRILTQKTWDRAAGSDTLKFTKTLTWNPDGIPATVAEGSDTLTYVYDNAGRLSDFKRGATILTHYTYTDGTSTIASRTDGTLVTAFTYDWARRMLTLNPDDAFVAGTVTRTYRLDGTLAAQSFPSSITETLAYDAVKRPTSISLGVAGSLSQAFDRAGRVTSEGRSLTGISGDAGTGTQSFFYDALSRLTSSTGLAVAPTYQYDLDGNRTSKVEGATTTTYTYDRADQVINQVIGATTRTFDYDRYGNLLTSADGTSAVTTYGYDEASRLTTISPPGGATTQVTFTLDALDRHATRAVNAVTTDTYAYLDATETAWQTGQGTTTSALLDADGSRLAIKTGSTVSWLVFDLHGSVAALCNTSGTLTDAYRYDGWGAQIAASGTASNPYRYRGLFSIGAGAWNDALLDMGARDYSPQLGVFTQQDSVLGSAANPLTMNRFLYALANPATLIDPDGHATRGSPGSVGRDHGLADPPPPGPSPAPPPSAPAPTAPPPLTPAPTPTPTPSPPGPLLPPEPVSDGNAGLRCAAGAIGGSTLIAAGGEVMIATSEGGLWAIGGTVATISGVGLVIIGGIAIVGGVLLWVNTC
jgi:RHS repeat-associated protein